MAFNDNLQKLLQGAKQGFDRIAKSDIRDYFLPTAITQPKYKKQLADTGRLLQGFPDTSVNIPTPSWKKNEPEPILKKIVKFTTGLPGEMIRDYGRTTEKIFEGQKLSGWDYLNLSDFVPGLGFIGGGVKVAGKKVIEKGVETTGKTYLKKSLNKLITEAGTDSSLEKAVIDRVVSGKSVLEDIYKGFEAGRTARPEAKGGLVRRTQLLDRLSPVYDFVKNAGRDLPAEINPYKRMRLLAGVSGKIEAVIKKGLVPVLRQNVNNLDDLSALLVMGRENELIGQGLKRARSVGEITQAVTELQAKYGEEGFNALKESANQVRQFGSKLLVRLNESGIISDEAFKEMISKNQFYVPFEAVDHISDALERGDNLRSSFNVAKQDVIKKIGDYKGAIADPLESILKQTSKTISLIEKNNAMKTLVNLRNVDPVFEELIKPIGKYKKVVERVSKTGKSFKTTVEALTPIEKGYDTINLFEDGKNVAYQIPQEVAAAVKNLDSESSNVLVKILSPQAKLLRAGATGLNIAFIPANIIRDVSDAIFTELSENGVRATGQLIASYPKAILSSIGKGDLYTEWLSSGGAQSTLTEQVFKKGGQSLKELSGQRNIIKTVISSPKSLIEFANRVGEQSTRIARFSAGLKHGEDIAEAAFKSRDITLDFAKSGTSIKTLNQVVPFLNAGIQGSEKLLRIFKNNPKQAILYSSILFATPTVVLYKHNSQFNDYKDIPGSEKMANWIFLSRDRTPEEIANGDDVKGFKVPKGFLGRIVSSLTESALVFASERDPKGLLNFLGESAEQFSPIGLPHDRASLGRSISTLMPPWFKAGLENQANRNFYFDSPIVPKNLEKVAPEEQYKDSTSEFAKSLGKLINVSPLKIENTVRTTVGGVGSQLMKLISGDIKGATVDEVTKRFTNIRSGDSLNAEFDDVAKYAEKSATESLKRKREAEEIYEELQGLSTKDAYKRATEVKRENPLLWSKIQEVAKQDKKDLTSLERFIATLPVEDGSRASYVRDKLQELDSKDEKEALVKLWIFKGIISEKVGYQLLEMKKSGELEL